MPRKRIIDPEFWSDQEIGFWSDKAKLFYIGLWNFADDEGRLKAHCALLKSQIFPYELKVDMEKLKLEISDKVEWYEINGIQYGYIRNFLKYQKIDKPSISKLPPPRTFDEYSTNTQVGLVPNISKEKISKEKGSREFLIEVKALFEYFCLKTNKKLSLTSEREDLIIKRLKEGRTVEEMQKAIDNFSKDTWEDRHKYCDIAYCFGNRNKINQLDKWLFFDPVNQVKKSKDIYQNVNPLDL